ncbi:RNA-dependent DNA polymerase [Phytophthora cinnamomi]|uniref:RNA-dependent DNA polymerase n=1 Tax=Phytophthora cinnamomi TaxID=4785 RepID=UPI00355A8EEC|nr:RNA-dependent DNA polymerase [Phytophthora cinnamomi]
MEVDALIVEGATEEFLLGEDWMLRKGVKIDFISCEMKWYEDDTKKIVPFQCSSGSRQPGVAAAEGTVGLFVPARRVEPHLFLAPTLSTVRGGKVVVPVMNIEGKSVRLPRREALGTWMPTANDVEVLEMTGEFGQDRDMVAMYVAEAQDDWDQWLHCAAYAYNGAKHSATGYSPNELMMGRKLRAPSELLRSSGITQTGPAAGYHRRLVNNSAKATSAAHAALAKDQLRRERYYNRRVRHDVEFGIGDPVWVFKPPRGKGITKLAHQWVGPARIVQAAGFDNWEVVRDDTDEHLIVHCSFLVSSRCPSDSLGVIAEKLLAELELEDDASDGELAVDDGAEQAGAQHDGETAAATTSSGNTADESIVGEGRDEGQMTRDDATRDVMAGTSGRGSATTTRPSVSVPTRTNLAGQDEEEKQRTGDGTARPGADEATRVSTAPADQDGDANEISQPGIAAPRMSSTDGARSSAAAQPKPAVRNRGWKRRAEADAEAKAYEETKGRRRREADEREARAARRQAARHEQEAAEAEAASTDAASGIHGGAEADDHEAKTIARRGPDADDHGCHGEASTDTEESAVDGERGATVEMLRGQGRPRWQPPMPELLQVETAGYIVERARRRVRNRAGRYVREHQVEYSTGPGRPTGRRWLTEEEFEQLEDAAKVVDDLGAGDGV